MRRGDGQNLRFRNARVGRNRDVNRAADVRRFDPEFLFGEIVGDFGDGDDRRVVFPSDRRGVGAVVGVSVRDENVVGGDLLRFERRKTGRQKRVDEESRAVVFEEESVVSEPNEAFFRGVHRAFSFSFALL